MYRRIFSSFLSILIIFSWLFSTPVSASPPPSPIQPQTDAPFSQHGTTGEDQDEIAAWAETSSANA